MSKTQETNLALFRASYVLNNTALVMSVMPFWWTGTMGVPTDVYLRVLATVSLGALLLDLPLSFVADKVGPKVTLAGGTLLFACSFFIVALGRTEMSFYAYGGLNTLAEGLLSGSANALLRQVAGPSRYRDELYGLNRWYYLLTSVLFFVGVGMYLWSPRLLFALQGALLVASFVLVCLIGADRSKCGREESEEKGAPRAPEFSNLIGSGALGGVLRFLSGTIAICILLGFFNGVSQFQNRTIQLLSGRFSIGGIDPLWTVAAFLFFGNLLTSLGVGRRVERSFSRLRETAVTIILTGAAAVAAVLLFLDSLATVFLGYLILCVLKGAYRAEYSDCVMRCVPFEGWTTRWLSVVNTCASLFASFLNMAISAAADSQVRDVQLAWAMLAVAVCLAGCLLLRLSDGASLPCAEAGVAAEKPVRRFDFNTHGPASAKRE